MKHRGVWLTTLSILIVLGAVCVAGGVVLTLRPAESPVEADTPTTPTTATSTYPRADGTLTDEEKAALNESVSRKMAKPLYRMLDEQWSAFSFDTDLFEAPERAAAFVWQLAVNDQSVPKIWDLKADGGEATGAVAIKEADYTAFYSRVLGQKADINALLVFDTPNFVLQDGYIYGHFPTGGRTPFELKVVSFAGNESTATLTVDMLTAFVEAEANGRPYTDFDYELLDRYWDTATLDYPAEAVFARMTLHLICTKEGYVADHLYFTKPT